MDKEMVIEKLKKMIDDLLHIAITDKDVNLFSEGNRITPVNMVYLLMELEGEFHITIDDNFIDQLPSITMNNLADAILCRS